MRRWRVSPPRSFYCQRNCQPPSPCPPFPKALVWFSISPDSVHYLDLGALECLKSNFLISAPIACCISQTRRLQKLVYSGTVILWILWVTVQFLKSLKCVPGDVNTRKYAPCPPGGYWPKYREILGNILKLDVKKGEVWKKKEERRIITENRS